MGRCNVELNKELLILFFDLDTVTKIIFVKVLTLRNWTVWCF